MQCVLHFTFMNIQIYKIKRQHLQRSLRACGNIHYALAELCMCKMLVVVTHVWCVAGNYCYSGSQFSKQCKIRVVLLICFITATSTFSGLYHILQDNGSIGCLYWIPLIKYLQLKSLFWQDTAKYKSVIRAPTINIFIWRSSVIWFLQSKKKKKKKNNNLYH